MDTTRMFFVTKDSPINFLYQYREYLFSIAECECLEIIDGFSGMTGNDMVMSGLDNNIWIIT